MATKVQRADLARKPGPVPTDPLSASIATAVRTTMLQLAEDGLLGGQGVQRLSYSPDEFGAANGMCGAKIRELIRRGMPALRIGAQWRVEPGPAMAWLRENGDYLADGGEP